MTYEEARASAIRNGALKPHGMKERMAAGILANQQGNIWAWEQTARAQQRLAEWTQAVLEGVDPRTLK